MALKWIPLLLIFFRSRMPRGGIGNNLQNTSSNQSDANYGFTAGIAECLLQSHCRRNFVLPALPVSWKNGSVTGLKARGGFEVNMEWKDGKLLVCTIKSILGNPCVVRYGASTKNMTSLLGIQYKSGKSYEFSDIVT